ncbi:MAG: hypothetical protein ACYTFN_21330, partial [Planctomycetota bacterium]
MLRQASRLILVGVVLTGGCALKWERTWPEAGPSDDAGRDAPDLGATCGLTTCPTGCCSGGQCLPGTVDTACGEGGDTCQDCTHTGDVCVEHQ